MGFSFSTSTTQKPPTAPMPQPSELPDLSLFSNRHINGFYYLPQDQQKALENDKKGKNRHKIPVRFKYSGHELENIVKERTAAAVTDDPEDSEHSDRDDEKHPDDEKQLVNNVAATKSELAAEFRHATFEWVYFVGDEGPYPISRELPSDIATEYKQARKYLALNDPIPDVFVRATMSHKVMKALIDTWMYKRHEKDLLCRLILKPLSIENRVQKHGRVRVQVSHPGLLIWSPVEGTFGHESWDKAILIHLITVRQATPDDEKDQQKEIEIKCEMVLRGQLDERGWQYQEATHPTQKLKLKNGVTDIAHWCLGYEMARNYEYHLYFTDCIQFMKELCDKFGIKYDSKPWSKNAPYAMSRRFEQCRRYCATHC